MLQLAFITAKQQKDILKSKLKTRRKKTSRMFHLQKKRATLIDTIGACLLYKMSGSIGAFHKLKRDRLVLEIDRHLVVRSVAGSSSFLRASYQGNLKNW